MDIAKEYSRYLSDFRGIDSTSEASQVSPNRFSFVQNMYKDYKSGQGTAIETFIGSRTLADFGGKINGIYTYKSSNDSNLYIVVHSGTKLYRFLHDKRDEISVSKTLIYDGLADRDSQGFVFNNRLFVIDGEHYIFVDENGKVTNIDQDSAYIPMTYTNGEQYEQRNMLTNKFKEKFFLPSIKNEFPELIEGSLEIRDGVVCAIVMMDEYYYAPDEVYPSGRVEYDSDIYILYTYTPRIVLDWTRHKKIYFGYDDKSDEIVNSSPNKEELTSFSMDDGFTEIEGTFEGFSSLKEIYLSNDIKSLPERFFVATAIETIRLPAALETIGENAFLGCTNLKTIYASEKICEVLKNGDFGIVEGVEIIPTNDFAFVADTPTEIGTRVYIYTPCESLQKVTLGETELKEYWLNPDSILSYSKVYKTLGDKRYIIAIDIFSSTLINVGENLNIEGTAFASTFGSVTSIYEQSLKDNIPPDYSNIGDDGSIFAAHDQYAKSSIEAIKGCTVVCTFDDRVFFTGNPDLPNTVFYTQRDLTGNTNPTFVGQLNWFDDGVGNEPNVAMMSNATTLMVLKGNTIQDGSIYYHVGADGGNDLTPRIYPSTEGLAGLGCAGLAVNFRDDCVFLSAKGGLEGISKQAVNLERTIAHRSTNIDGLLLKENLTQAKAAEWEGYLCILINGKMFLADSRQVFEGIGGVEYEWYYINPVGSYRFDNRVYSWADIFPEHLDRDELSDIQIYNKSYGEKDFVHPTFEDVRSAVTNNGTVYYYQVLDGVKYLVDWDGEDRQFGEFDAARTLFCVEEILYLGTVSGQLVCLNNDKRGTDEDEPDKSRIPTRYYNNSGHAYDAVALLAMENAGVPHLTKTTVKRGTVVRLKSFPRSFVEISASTDRQELTLLAREYMSVTNFGDFDFANLGLLTTDSNILAIKEKTKKWVEKQYMFHSDRSNQPFGIYSITYRYNIVGEVKNR